MNPMTLTRDVTLHSPPYLFCKTIFNIKLVCSLRRHMEVFQPPNDYFTLLNNVGSLEWEIMRYLAVV